MAVVNIKTISKLLVNNPLGRKIFVSAISIILYILESQRLIDYRKLESVSLDWERGTLKLGDGFMEMIIGRSVSQYVIDRKKKEFDFKLRSNWQIDDMDSKTYN